MTKPLPLPDLEYLRQILSYDQQTGLFYWKLTRGPCSANSIAGRIVKGYIRICVDGKSYSAHRIAWYFLTSVDPGCNDIDHINGNKKDNRALNLRISSRSENLANAKKGKRNTSGFKGVCFDKRSGKWVAHICINYKQIHIGYFDAPELAHMAYCKRAIELKGQFARTA